MSDINTLWYGWQVWRQLTATDIRLLNLLRVFSKRYSVVFPSQKTLAKHLEVCERTVGRSIAHLRALGQVLVRPRTYRDRLGRLRNYSNLYKLCTKLGKIIAEVAPHLTGRTGWSAYLKQKKKDYLRGKQNSFFSSQNREQEGEWRPELIPNPQIRAELEAAVERTKQIPCAREEK